MLKSIPGGPELLPLECLSVKDKACIKIISGIVVYVYSSPGAHWIDKANSMGGIEGYVPEDWRTWNKELCYDPASYGN